MVPADVAEVAERYDGYTSAGVVHRFEVDGNDTTFSLLMRDEVKMAARRLALGQLRKGRGAFSRHHNDAFVDAIFAKWLQTSTIPAILRRCEPACATTGGRLGTRRDAEFGPAERSQSREAGVVEQEDNIGGPVQRHWRVFGTGPGREGCIATDWDGRVLAHEVTGPLKETFDRAVADFCTHDQLVSSLPAGALEPVTQSLNAPAGPLTRLMPDDPSRKLATAIALDPFTSGTWLVETDSGSRYSFDLDYGAYARHPDVGGQAMEGDGEFALIVEVLQWPSVNSGFVLIDQWTDPSIPEHELRDEDVRERRLTSSWVTSIVEIPRDLWRAEPVTLEPLAPLDAISQVPPRNAWLLMGDERSPMVQEDLEDGASLEWTCSKHVQRGDLALFYYQSPTKAITHVGRIATPPVFDPASGDSDTYPHHWWAEVEGVRAVPPMSYSRLKELFGGQLVLRGKAGVFVPPNVVEVLQQSLVDDPALGGVLQVPTGDSRLPAVPQNMSMDVWRNMASGPFLLEKHVEIYVVEPLLQWLVTGLDGASWRAKASLGKLVPDYTLYRHGKPAAIVEVKMGVRGSTDGRAWGGPDAAQLRKYCSAASAPGLLVDANRILLFGEGREDSVGAFERAHLTDSARGLIREHVFGSQRDES